MSCFASFLASTLVEASERVPPHRGVTVHSLALGMDIEIDPSLDATSDTPLPPGEQLAFEAMRSRLFPDVGHGPKIGRFTVLRLIGKGGMGVVFAAYDEDLDRKVAVKLLRGRGDGEGARARLLREAQGLARLSHPNVVQVHEVGEDPAGVFVAMEFVAGETLGHWASVGRSWRELLTVLIAAGRGLAAAHAAGLVHRDFKPDNVIVASDGRPRVLDFGLVRGLDEALVGSTDDSDAPLDEAVSEPATALLHRSLTTQGTLMGTPAYMAPEQLRGERCDALADQFAFCVTAFELLFGQRPFAGRSFHTLATNVRGSAIQPIPSDTPVPKPVREAILRGLAIEPGARWPDMGALLDALEVALQGRRRRATWAIAGLLGAGVAAVTTWALIAPEQPQLCAMDATALAGTWDDERRAAVREAFVASGLVSAQPSFATLAAGLDDWSARWLDAKQRACVATRIDGTQSDALLERRMDCLERKRRAFAVLTQELAGAERELVANAGELLGRLPSLEACDDPQRIDDRFPAPSDPRLRAAVEAAEDQLVRGRLMLRTGQLDRAEALAERLRGQTWGPEQLPLLLDVRAFAGELAIERQKLDEAVPALLEVAREAEAHRLDELAANVYGRLAFATAGIWSQPRLEQWLLDDAEAALARLDQPSEPLSFDLRAAEARLRCQAGDHEAARSSYAELRERATAIGDEPGLIHSSIDLGNELLHLRLVDDARAVYEQALAHVVAAWGPRARWAANLHFDLALLELASGRLEPAEQRLAAARSIYVEVFGEDSLECAQVDLAAVEIAKNRSDLAGAQQLLQRALPVLERSLGREHEEYARALTALGVIRYFLGDLDGSLDAYERALDIQRRLLGESHEEIARLHTNIAESWLALGDVERALAGFEAALAILERIFAPEHPQLAFARRGRGTALFALGRGEEARTELERALAIHAATPNDPIEAAETALALAELLLALGRERARALALASSAAEGFAAVGQLDRARAAEMLMKQ